MHAYASVELIARAQILILIAQEWKDLEACEYVKTAKTVVYLIGNGEH